MKHDSLPQCLQMYVYEASIYYLLLFDKSEFVTKRELSFEYI
jgi:hypothetical protein